MSNPTLQAGLQFTQPFDILPNVVYTNPTTPSSPQFNNNFDLPGPSQQFFIDRNPTTNQSQFFDRQQQPAVGYYGNPTTIPQISTTQLTGLPNVIGASTIGVSVQPQAPGAVSLFGLTVTNQTPTQFQKHPEIADRQTPPGFIHTNVNLKSTVANVYGFASLAAGSLVGIPQIGQIGASIVNGVDNSLSGTYTTLPFDKLTNNISNIKGVKINSPVLYSDFRSRLNIDRDSNAESGQFGSQVLAYITSRRIDGTSAATRGSVYAGIYAATAVTPIGPYSIFNLDGSGKTGYGWGEHDNPNAIRKDFTMRSHIAKQWKQTPGQTAEFMGVDAAGNVLDYAKQIIPPRGEFVPTRLPNELATPFRGDKVNVIDYGKRTLNQAYLWKPSILDSAQTMRDGLVGELLNNLGLTQDFIKFYFTGPKLQAGNSLDKDDIIVFRAVLTVLSDSHAASWNPVNMIGRADPNYVFNQTTRDLQLGFDVYATDRDEMQSIYRKLNALAGYTAPTYDADSIAMTAPWMRITIGDLFVQTPVILNNLSFDFDVTGAPWEINIEKDPNMMQVPFKVSVTCGFNVISDFLPQNGGRFYTLAKRFADDGTPLTGNDNWLSDSKGNLNLEEIRRKFNKLKNRSKVVGNSSSTRKTETTKSSTYNVNRDL